jgi:hypothetical protein
MGLVPTFDATTVQVRKATSASITSASPKTAQVGCAAWAGHGTRIVPFRESAG